MIRKYIYGYITQTFTNEGKLISNEFTSDNNLGEEYEDEKGNFIEDCSFTEPIEFVKPELPPRYVIRNSADNTYWSNDVGWTGYNEATKFKEKELELFKYLPINGEWVKYG